MINSIKILVATVSLLLTFIAATVQEDNPKIIGLISPEILVVDNFYDLAIDNPDYKNYPHKELKLFTQPGVPANKSIKLEQAENEHSLYLKTYLVDAEGNETYPFNSSTIWTKFKSYNLVYYETRGDFVKVKVSGSFYWLNTSQMADFGFSSQNWADYFQFENSKNLIVNINLNLRDQPGINSEKILTINKNVPHELEILGNFRGDWAEVHVTVYKGSWGVYSMEIDKQVTGWIKFLDKNGKPNIQISLGWGC